MGKHIEPKRARVLVTGLARDTANRIGHDIQRLISAFDGFAKLQVYVVESDSSDGTELVLGEISKLFENICFTSLGCLQDKLPKRIDRLSYCRNFAQERIRKQFTNFDYVCVADLDGTNSLLSKDAISSCWDRLDWDVCTANQIGPYYDIFALRHPQWSPTDYWKEIDQLVSQGINPMKARRIALHRKQKRIPLNSSWIEVDSAFGGLAIYTWESFMQGKYDSKDNRGHTICEHVPFHTEIRKRGFRIFINPNLINHKTKRFINWKARFRFYAKYVFSYLETKPFRDQGRES
jgi:hypothetical protein